MGVLRFLWRTCVASLRWELPFCLSSSTQKDVETEVTRLASIQRNRTGRFAVMGPPGSGKSTFINSLATASTGRTEKPAGAGDGTESLTIERTDITLQFLVNSGKNKEDLQDGNISMVDSPGGDFEVLTDARRDMDDDSCTPEQEQELKNTFEREVATTIDWIVANHVGCLKVTLALPDLDTDWVKEEEETGREETFRTNSAAYYQMKVIKALHVAAKHRKVEVFCNLTKADLVDENVQKIPALIVYSKRVDELRRAVSKETGMLMDQIFACVNLTSLGPGHPVPLPQSQPALCRLLLHIAYTIMHNTRHASKHRTMDAPQRRQPTPPTASSDLEPAADEMYIVTSSAAPSEHDSTVATSESSSWANASYRSSFSARGAA